MKSRIGLPSFLDDIDERKLPEKVKLSIASAGFTKMDTADNEMSLANERDRSLDILQQLLPEANLFVKNKHAKEFKAVARFDPSCQSSSHLEIKAMTKPHQNELKNKKNQNQAGFSDGKRLGSDNDMTISKGIDKKKAQIEKANQILKKSIDIYSKSVTKPNAPNDSNVKVKGKSGAGEPEKAVKRKIVKEIKTQKWKDISSQKSELKAFKLFG